MKQYLPAIHGRDKAQTFVEAWMLALGDRAALYRPDARLTATAQAHAAYLTTRKDVSTSMHIGANNSTANERVRASGYRLPDFYPLVGNSVESTASNWHGPTYALGRLLLSPLHRAHLLGENGFSSHSVFGVGNAGDYWVILACPQEGA